MIGFPRKDLISCPFVIDQNILVSHLSLTLVGWRAAKPPGRTDRQTMADACRRLDSTPYYRCSRLWVPQRFYALLNMSVVISIPPASAIARGQTWLGPPRSGGGLMSDEDLAQPKDIGPVEFLTLASKIVLYPCTWTVGLVWHLLHRARL